jgi:hypothetical protein
VGYARKVVISSGEVHFYGGRKEELNWLEARPCKSLPYPFPQIDHIFPDANQMGNAPGKPVAFNADYMKVIAETAAKFSETGVCKMHLAALPTSPLLFTASAENAMIEMVLMPVQVRN